MSAKKVPIAERLLRRSEVDAAGCLIWNGSSQPSGYGTICVDRRTVGVHRVAYEEWVGNIPSGFEIDHLCRVPRCINPEHLEPVTPEENWRRRFEANGFGPYATSCANGHSLDETNTYVQPKTGWRRCRACARERARAWRSKRSAA